MYYRVEGEGKFVEKVFGIYSESFLDWIVEIYDKGNIHQQKPVSNTLAATTKI